MVFRRSRKSPPHPAVPPTARQRAGAAGEATALAYLQQQGLALVDRNFRTRGGEIDLILQEAGTLVFVEVRQRRTQRYGGAAASVTATKQARLVGTAQMFLQRYATPPPCRFDVLAIEGNTVHWLKNVIEL